MSKQNKYSDDFPEFWDSVDRWQQQLRANSDTAEPLERPRRPTSAAGGGPGNDSLNRLENAWAQCIGFSEWPLFSDRDNAKTVSRSPLGVLFGYIDCGLYPPPEVLLALLDRFNSYMDAEGNVDLETTFFGKPVQGAGNYAKRSAKRRRDTDIAFRMAMLNCNGSKDAAAGEIVSNELASEGIVLDTETVIAIANKEMPRVSRKK